MTITKRNSVTGRFESRIVCHSCALIRISGIICHEAGCPDAWRDSSRECRWCGSDFVPDDRWQRCCSDDCAESLNS